MTEREEIEKKIKELTEPLEKRLRELRDKENADYEAKQKKFYKENIEGRIFYGDKTTWPGWADHIVLIKPTGCEDWGPYNVCHAMEMMTYPNKNIKTGNYSGIRIESRTVRVDNFATHFKELTPEILEGIKKKTTEELDKSLSIFDQKQ